MPSLGLFQRKPVKRPHDTGDGQGVISSLGTSRWVSTPCHWEVSCRVLRTRRTSSEAALWELSLLGRAGQQVGRGKGPGGGRGSSGTSLGGRPRGAHVRP